MGMYKAKIFKFLAALVQRYRQGAFLTTLGDREEQAVPSGSLSLNIYVTKHLYCAYTLCTVDISVTI